MPITSDNLNTNFAEPAKRRIRERVESVLDKVEEAIKVRFVPVDTGNLRSTIGWREAPGGGLAWLVGTIQPVEYAAFVHENLGGRRSGERGPKYVERALIEYGPRISRAIGEAV